MSIPVLLLFSDTGGGHRSAAQAVAGALNEEYPGVFAPLLHDPLRTSNAPLLLRGVASLYGPITRYAPWAWGAVFHASDSRLADDLLRRTWLRLADAPVARVVAAHRPALVLSFHPLTTAAAVRAMQHHDVGSPVVTVVTDLITTHATWRYAAVDWLVAPSVALKRRCEADALAPERCLDFGLPVGSSFRTRPLSVRQQWELRRQLGVDPWRFLVVLTGGGEGLGPIVESVQALTRAFDDVDVVAICGRNRRIEQRLTRRASQRLTVKGFVDNMADWYRAADVVVTKAGPQTIAETTCCGAALLVTSHLPGQERGNTELVVGAGAAMHTPQVEDLVHAVGHLKRNPVALQAMRRASLAIARPEAARQVASLVAHMAPPHPPRMEHDGAA
jgi:1,2-diacylglycerol 3-beta-galactosyltransferase